MFGGLPPAATASVAAHEVARRLPATAGRALLSSANHAYLHGLVEVAVIGAVVLIVGAVLVLLFLPGRERGGEPVPGSETRGSSPCSDVEPGVHPA